MYKIKLSPYAKIFYTEWLINPESSIYNLVIDQVLHGDLSIAKLKKALKRYVADHVILNSHVKEIHGEAYWVKNSEIVELECLDHPVSSLQLFDYVSKGFDVCNGPLYRFRLLRIDNEIYRLILVLHHIVADGSSGNNGVFEAISNYYNDEKYVVKYSIDEQIKLISNLSEALSSRLEQNKNKCNEFWIEQLKDVEPVDLRYLKRDRHDRKNTIIEKLPGEIRFNYDAIEISKLNQIKRQYVITPYIYSLCIFALLVHRYTGQEQLAIAYATSIKEGIDFIYGAQVNTNFIPYHFTQSTTIIDLFNQSKNFFKSLKEGNFNYSYYPVMDIIRNSDKNLLNLYFIQPNFKDKTFVFSGITKVETLNEFNLDSVDPLVFEQALDEQRNKQSYRVRYDKNLIDEELLNNFVGSFKKLFLSVLDDLINSIGSDRSLPMISSYNLLDHEQQQKLIYAFNRTQKDYPRNQTLPQLFKEQVRKTPHKVAVIFANIELTYEELDKKTNRIACYLQTSGIKTGDPVALYMHRSLSSVVAIVSIIKVGAIYVPLDPAYPQNRILYMLKDSGCRFCLTSDELYGRCKSVLSGRGSSFDQKINIVNIAEISMDGTHIENQMIANEQNPLNAAYIMYTSGTTGEPKGIKINHRGIIRVVKDTNYINFEPDDRIAHTTSISFDISTVEIWGSLLNGLTMIVVSQGIMTNFNELARLAHEQTVTIMCMAPTLFNMIVTVYCSMFMRLRFLLICGEKLNSRHLPYFFANNKSTRLINCYGPTESTSYATFFEIPRNWSNEWDIPIGKPIANTTAYVLDNNLQLLPIGAVGELCLGGDGLAIGYHNNPDLTNSRFVDVVLDKKNIVRMYRTGDVVRILPDGNIEYFGRNDFQVKIKGQRIELGEIETKLNEYSGIKQAIVLVKNNLDIDERYLVAYYVASNKLAEEKIREYLAKQLPRYMLPNFFIYLKKMPLTPNGKINRKALSDLKIKKNNGYVSPNSEQERLICEAFAKVLKLKKVGINDDFFALGGDSLKAISLVTNLQNYFDIKVADVFNLRTPAKLAENSYFAGDMLKQMLERIKLLYQERINYVYTLDKQTQEKIDSYLRAIPNWKIDCSLKKPIANVLLTGATGFLGCNILNQLLNLTDYKIFLLVRATSQEEAVERINNKFQIYFDKTLKDIYNSRVFVIKADIEKNNLGLSEEEYKFLITTIDSVIHSAAIVKQYGEYNKFYAANVQATVNLLKFTELTKLKDFHYISTSAVLNFGTILTNGTIFTENDMPDDLGEYYNVYSKTKLQGEHQVCKYRQNGIKSNIYRLGNLAFMMKNSRTQENVEDNGFFGFIKFLFKMKCIAKELSMVEMSPADFTAQAIIKLFDKEQLSNNTYHLFNNNLFDLCDFFTERRELKIQILSIGQFIDSIISKLNDNGPHDLIIKFISRQGWLDGRDTNIVNPLATTKILHNFTQYILKQLDCEWTSITNDVFDKYLKLLNL